jgi:hypothetical protein
LMKSKYNNSSLAPKLRTGFSMKPKTFLI